MTEMAPERDLRQFWAILRARKHSFIWPAAAILLISMVVALALPPVYESTCTILIEEQQIPPEFVKSTVTGFADQRIQMLNQQILSRTRLLEIIKKFNLYSEMRGRYTQEEIIETMRDDIKVSLISAEVTDRKKRRAQTEGVTIAFTIAYRGKNPSIVQEVNGTLASLYLQENIKIREQQAKTTTKFLEAELKEIKERIKNIGENLTEFKAKNEGILPEQHQFNLALTERLERDIEQVKVQIRANEDRNIYLEGQLATVKPDSPIISSTGQPVMDANSRLHQLEMTLCDLESRYSQDHPDICRINREIDKLKKLTGSSGGKPFLKRQKLTQLRAELAQQQGRYSDDHPEVLKLKREIARLESLPKSPPSLKPATQPENPAYINLLTNIQTTVNDIQALKEQQKFLEDKLKVYRERLERAPLVEQEYLALSRDYQNAHAKHQEVMNKILEARIAEGMEESQKAEKFTLIDPASYPEKPVAPKRRLIVLAGLVLGLGVGFGMVALTENLDHSVKNVDELAKLTGMPILGSVARIVTPAELALKKQRRRVIWSLTGVSLVAGLIIFHLFVMDLWILTAKFGRLAQKYL